MKPSNIKVFLFLYRVFLLIQLISVISFITWLNECYQSKKDAERWLVLICQEVPFFFFNIFLIKQHTVYFYVCSHVHVMLLATTSYTVCIVGLILMYIWYAPDSWCLLNKFFITWTLFLLQLMTSIALHPKVSNHCNQHLCHVRVYFRC